MTDRKMLEAVRRAIFEVLEKGQSASITTPDGSSRSFTRANLNELKAYEKALSRRLSPQKIKMSRGVFD